MLGFILRPWHLLLLFVASHLNREQQRVIEFLQVEMDGERSTYQFAPGVAPTSLATSTARRLGVTLEKLSALVERHGGATPSAEPAPEPTRKRG